MRRRLLLEESNDVPALEPTPDGHIALGVNSMNLKNRLCDVETDRRHSLHGPVLRIRSPTATMAPTCRWRSRPQHHYQSLSGDFGYGLQGAGPRLALRNDRSGINRTVAARNVIPFRPAVGLRRALRVENVLHTGRQRATVPNRSCRRMSHAAPLGGPP